MKRMSVLLSLLLPLAASAASAPAYRMIAPDGFLWPESAEEGRLLGAKNELIDLDGDGTPERIVSESASGTGGPMWHVERRDAQGSWKRISGNEGFLGWGELAKSAKRGGFSIKLTTRCGWRERFFALYEFDGSAFSCVRIESMDYKDKTLKILHGRLPWKDASVSATLYRIERAIRRALETDDATDSGLVVQRESDRAVFLWRDDSRADGPGFRIVADFRPNERSGRTFYGCEKPYSLDASFDDGLAPELRARLEKALSGTFVLLVSVQSECSGDSELAVEIDGVPFVRTEIPNDRTAAQEKPLAFPAFLDCGRHDVRATAEGCKELNDSFTLSAEKPCGILYFESSPWYEFWAEGGLWFRLRSEREIRP